MDFLNRFLLIFFLNFSNYKKTSEIFRIYFYIVDYLAHYFLNLYWLIHLKNQFISQKRKYFIKFKFCLIKSICNKLKIFW